MALGTFLWLIGAKDHGYIYLWTIAKFAKESAMFKNRDYGQIFDIASCCYEAAKEIGILSDFKYKRTSKFLIEGEMHYRLTPERLLEDRKKRKVRHQKTRPVFDTEKKTKPLKFAKSLSQQQEIRREQLRASSRPKGTKELLPYKASCKA